MQKKPLLLGDKKIYSYYAVISLKYLIKIIIIKTNIISNTYSFSGRFNKAHSCRTVAFNS